MVVFARRNLIDIFPSVEYDLPSLGRPQVGEHLLRIYSGFEPEVNHGVLIRVHQIVTLILSVRQAETLLDELGGRVNLKTQVTSPDGVQEVEPDREIFSETAFHRSTEQFSASQ